MKRGYSEEQAARELLQETDLTTIPKWERFTIDEKTTIDVPITGDITDNNFADGDQVTVLMTPDRMRLVEVVIVRKKQLSR